jgi:flagellar protein FlgJ
MLAPPAPSVHDFQGLARLREQAQRHDPAALEETAVQFEALVVGMMLKASREASLGEGIFDNAQTQQYLELMDQQVALELARQGGLGFGKLLVEGVRETWETEQPFQPANAEEFVETLMPMATEAGRDLGVDPRLLIAQSALETGWGRAVLRHPDGRPAFNLFGIKAGGSWSGPRVAQPTIEFTDGVAERRWEQFRAYPSAAASFRDYAALIGESARYSETLRNPNDPEAYARGLAQGGYATDPEYAEKWLAIYHGDTLRDAVQRLKTQELASTH